MIREYDHDQLYPCYGFGAVKPGAGAGKNHCFPLNDNPSDPHVRGVEGILGAYASALTQWGLSGPTIFSQVIGAAAGMARQSAAASSSANPGTYTILLIVTDGVITDLEATKEAIVAASDLPLSIIIIGVGDADFSAMHALDSDEVT